MGWPEERKFVNEKAKPYFTLREELTECDIFLRGERIIIPKEKRSEVLKILHSNHVGIEYTETCPRCCVLAWNDGGNKRRVGKMRDMRKFS